MCAHTSMKARAPNYQGFSFYTSCLAGKYSQLLHLAELMQMRAVTDDPPHFHQTPCLLEDSDICPNLGLPPSLR